MLPCLAFSTHSEQWPHCVYYIYVYLLSFYPILCPRSSKQHLRNSQLLSHSRTSQCFLFSEMEHKKTRGEGEKWVPPLFFLLLFQIWYSRSTSDRKSWEPGLPSFPMKHKTCTDILPSGGELAAFDLDGKNCSRQLATHLFCEMPKRPDYFYDQQEVVKHVAIFPALHTSSIHIFQSHMLREKVLPWSKPNGMASEFSIKYRRWSSVQW